MKRITISQDIYMIMEPVEVSVPPSVKQARVRVAVAVVAVIAISTGVFLATSSDTGVTVNITSITLHIGYGSSTDSFFGSPTQNLTANYETYGGGHTASFRIAFHNYGSRTHSITTVFVRASGFTALSENPILPLNVAAGQTSYVTVNIHVPDHNFAGALDIYAVAS